MKPLSKELVDKFDSSYHAIRTRTLYILSRLSSLNPNPAYETMYDDLILSDALDIQTGDNMVVVRLTGGTKKGKIRKHIFVFPKKWLYETISDEEFASNEIGEVATTKVWKLYKKYH